MVVKPAAFPKGQNGISEERTGIPIPAGPVPKLALNALISGPYGTSPPQRDPSPLSDRLANSPSSSTQAYPKMMQRFASQTGLKDAAKAVSKLPGRNSFSGDLTPPKKPTPKESPSPGRSLSSSPQGFIWPATSQGGNALIVKKKLESLSRLLVDHHFDVKQAEIDLFICLHNYPDELDLMINLLVYLRQAIQNERRSRMDELLCRMMLRAENMAFLNAYFKRTNEDLNALAVKAMPFMLKKKDIWEIILLLSDCTREDLKSQTLDTLFRENCFLSSFLCRELGIHLWSKDLKALSEILLKDLKKADNLSLCLDRKLIDHLPDEATLRENAEHFSQWANRILPSIFSLNVPESFSSLLKTRRLDITRFLNSQSSTGENPIKASRTYVGELLCQRILCPQILQFVDKDKHPDIFSILLSLTKVIKCLSHESEFDANQGIYASLNPLLEENRAKFQSYIDSISLER